HRAGEVALEHLSPAGEVFRLVPPTVWSGHASHPLPRRAAQAAGEPVSQVRKAVLGRVEVAVDAAVFPGLDQGGGDVDVGQREGVASRSASAAALRSALSPKRARWRAITSIEVCAQTLHWYMRPLAAGSAGHS